MVKYYKVKCPYCGSAKYVKSRIGSNKYYCSACRVYFFVSRYSQDKIRQGGIYID